MSSVDQIGWHAESKTGVIAAGGAGAVAAGIEILGQGGNSADAAAGAIIALNVTDHGACSIGGEVPVLVWDGNAVKSLSGQGRAPLSPEAIAWYMEHGIPDHDIKMAPVPSVVDLCITLLQQYGTQSFAAIVAPTLALLDEGEEVWHPDLARTLRRMVEEEHRATGNRQEKLQAACDHFYGRRAGHGDIAADLEAFYVEQGGFLRRADLAAHRTLIEEPVAVDYRGYQVYKCGPWTQGPYLCQALRLLEGFDLKSMGHCSADYVHAVVEAMKLAMADRDAHYGDPLFVDVPMNALLSDEYTRAPAALDRHGASRVGRSSWRPARHEGTAGGRRVPARSRRHHHVRGGRPLGHGRIGYAERECLSRWRHRQHGSLVWQPPAQPQHNARTPQLHRAGQAAAHHL